MKKRYILFGYQIQNGEFCIVQQEGAAVEYIFDAYSNGDSLQQIATHMSSCGPPYRSSDNRWNKNIIARLLSCDICNGVQREHNKKLNNGLPILHKVPPKRDYGRYFCIMAEKGGTSHGGLTEKLSPFFHAKKQEVNAYGR